MFWIRLSSICLDICKGKCSATAQVFDLHHFGKSAYIFVNLMPKIRHRDIAVLYSDR
jgi:hypothetical protein